MFRWLHPAAALLAVVLLLGTSCRQNGDAAVDISAAVDTTTTPQPTPGRVQNIVTRLVEQITFVTSTPDPLAPSTEETTPVVLDISLTGELPDLDPGLAERQSQLELTQNLFVGLTNYDPDTNTIEPELASTWALGADGTTWTFNLRDDIYWVRPRGPGPGRDGLWGATQVRPVTADDVVYAVQRQCSREANTPVAFSLFIIRGCEAVFTTLEPTEAQIKAIGIESLDPTTLQIHLTKPAGYFLTLTSMPFFQPVPADMVAENGNEWLDAIGEYSTGWQTPDNLVTSGPYLPVSNQFTSQYVVLHRNPLWPLERPGNVDVVNITFLDEQDAFEMWQERLLDIAPLPPDESEAFKQRSAIKVKTIPDQVLFYLGFNFDSGVFREAEVRRAFSAAIDRQVLLDELYDGRGLAMRHASVPGMVAAIPFEELGVGYSPDFARQQMAASSFRSCRLLPEITFLVSSADLSLLQAEIIRNMWVEELECVKENIHIQQVQFGGLLAGTQQDATDRPDLWELAWAPTFPDAKNLITDLLHCDESENRQNRPCSAADSLLDQAGTVVDPVERMSRYRQAESQFFNETGSFPIAPLYVRAREIVVHDWINFSPVAFGGQQWDRIMLDASLKELERSLTQ
ncbi:MAG: peptide ABC transporter substrate-binding protein [Anaerolineales bacterium]|nr:peptide ABC transporter substrate-binding protein [Anaerolineales bacterium]MCB8934650.1 peptide ABC transporter substrate-binding protein [Promineifilum sp.]